MSWRKPTTFGISFGLTTVTLGWVGGSLLVRRTVGWVTVQHARGVPAHFNDTN